MEYVAEKALAHDIIKQACQDYVKFQLLSMGITRKENQGTGEVIYGKKVLDLKKSEDVKTFKKIRREILELLDFFRSEWFEQLCDYSGFDGNRIITKLNMMIKKFVAEYHEAMKKEGERIIAERNKKDAA